MSSGLAVRLFRQLVVLQAARGLGPGKRNQQAYEAFFRALAGSGTLRWLFARIDTGFSCNLQEYIVYVASFVFQKRGIPNFYLPVEWSGTGMEPHLGKPAIFLSRHNGFAFTTKAITDHGMPVAVLAESAAAVPRRHARSGVLDPSLVTLVRPDANALLHLRKALEKGMHVACFADRLDRSRGKYAVEPGLFQLAAMTGAPLYFTRFTVNENGRVAGTVKGPVDSRDAVLSRENFIGFSGA